MFFPNQQDPYGTMKGGSPLVSSGLGIGQISNILSGQPNSSFAPSSLSGGLPQIGAMGGSAGGMGTQGLGLIGRGVGVGLGITQLIASGVQNRKAKKAMPELVDAGQVSALESLKRELRGIESGTAFNVQRALLGKTGAATRSAIARNSGGDVQSTVSAFLKSQAVQNQGLNNSIAMAESRQDAIRAQAVQQQNAITARKTDIQMYESLQHRARAAQLSTSGQQNIMRGIFGI